MNIDVVIHDVHGFMSHHPHRTIRAFMTGWEFVTGYRPDPSLALEVLQRSTEETMKAVVAQLAEREGYRDVAEEIAVEVSRQCQILYIPNRGVRPTIKKLHELGVMQIVLTNGYLSQVQPVLDSWGVSKYFQGVYGRRRMTGRPKPNINLWKDVFPHHNIEPDPKRVLMVGDYIGDIETAHNNNISGVMLVTTRNGRLYTPDPKLLIVPDYVILEPSELLDIVDGTYSNVTHALRLEKLFGDGLTTKTTNIWSTKSGQK